MSELRHGVGLCNCVKQVSCRIQARLGAPEEPADRNAYGKSPPAPGFKRFVSCRICMQWGAVTVDVVLAFQCSKAKEMMAIFEISAK